MNNESLQRRLLELQSKIQQGQEAMREWADLQTQLQSPNLATGNVNPYLNAARSVHTQNPPPSSGRQEAGPSHPPATNLNVQQRPSAQAYSPNYLSQAENGGAPALPSVRQPQAAQSYTQAPGRHDGSTLDARNRATVQIPHVPTPPPNQSTPAVNGLAAFPSGLETQAQKLAYAAYLRNASGYAASGQGARMPVPQQQQQQQQQQPAVPAQGTTASSVQPMHAMQVAPQQPQTNGPSSTKFTFPASGQTYVPTPQHQPYNPPGSNSVSSNTQPLGASRAPLAPPPRTNRSIGHLPEWTDTQLRFFKHTLEAWRRNVTVGTSFSLSQFFQFGEGFSIRSLVDGLYVEDDTDKLKCPVSALYEQLEKRKKPEPAPQVGATSSPIPQATTAQARPLSWPKSIASSTSSTPSSLTAQPTTSTAQSHAVISVLNSGLPAQPLTVLSRSNSGPQLPTSASQAPLPPNPRVPVSFLKSRSITTPVSTPNPTPNPPPALPAFTNSVVQLPTATPPAVAPGPATPTTPSTRGSLATVSRSPASANKKTLARDLLFALGKRPRPSNEQTPGPAAKRPAMGAFGGPPPKRASAVVDGIVLLQPRPPLPPSIGVPPSSSQGNSPATIMGSTSSGLSSLPACAPQDIVVNVMSSTSNPARAVEANQPLHPTQASQNPPATVAPPAPIVAPRPPSPVASAPQGIVGLSNTPNPAVAVEINQPSPSSLPASAPQDIVVNGMSSTPNPAVAIETNQPSQPTQADENPPITVAQTAPIAALQPPSPARPQSSPPEHFVSSPSLPPIATIDEGASSPSRPATPALAQKPARSPSSTASDFAPYPPPSSKGTVSDVSQAGPSSSKKLVVEARSSPGKRKASPAISISSDGSEPLFLPSASPPSSPGPVSGAARPQKIVTAGKGKGKEREREQVYVLIPPPSPRTKRFMELQRQPAPSQVSRSTSTQSTKTPGRSSSRPAVAPNMLDLDLWPLEEEDEKEYDYSYDAQGNKIEDPFERMLMEQACTQLQSLPCKWDRCEVVMNSVIGMLSHLKKQHRPVTKDGRGHFSCRWSQCGKQCRPKDNKHFVKHALEYLRCPYIGCHAGFRTLGQLRRHANSHPDTDRFKPTCKPFAPTNLVPPPAAPDVLPSFMVVTRPVRPASISPALHEQLYPKVLKKVKGLAKRSKLPIRLEQYSFLTNYPMRASSYHSQPAEGVKIDDMDWTVRLTELCRQDRVTIFGEGSKRVVIARTPTPEYQMKEEVQEEEQIRLEFPSEPEVFGLEEARSASQEPAGQTQIFLEQEEEEEDGEETESEVYGVGRAAGIIDDDEVDEAGESDLVASLLL